MKKVIILFSIFIFVIVPVVFIIIVYAGAFGHLQSKQELLNYKNATASLVNSHDGELIGKIFAENRTNIRFEDLPPYFVDALIATEDVRFYKHGGIDVKSLFRVLVKTIIFRNENSGGGSTITQQLAKNMFGRDDYGRFGIFINKAKEALLAIRLEKAFSKEDILTLYLNTVSFGENVYGIEAASLRYFNKPVPGLSIEESAVLIGMLKANNYYNPRLNPENSLQRRNVVLSQMEKYGFITETESDSVKKLPLVIKYTNFEVRGPADYFVYQVKNVVRQILADSVNTLDRTWNIEEDGLIITTTLDLTLQNYADSAFRKHMPAVQEKLDRQYGSQSGRRSIDRMVKTELKRLNLSSRAKDTTIRLMFDWKGSFTDTLSIADSIRYALKILHAGLMAMDPSTGEVKAWVGGIDFKTQPYDQVLARRQLASTFKPILYATAIEDGISPCFYLDNDSIVVRGLEEDWIPRNFERDYGGKYSLTGALIRSMNVPTFNLYREIGFEKLDSMWKNMGFGFTIHDEPSLSLGTAEASIRETAIAYASFANGGYKVQPRIIESVRAHDGTLLWENRSTGEKTRIMSQRTSSIISEILQRAVNYGTGASLRYQYGIGFPVAGKTGTSQDYADAWFAGFNPGLVIVSRVGASLPSIHFYSGNDGAGSALALPLVGLTLNKLQADKKLLKETIKNFPSPGEEVLAEMDCPDFREKNIFENFMEIFRKDDITYDAQPDSSIIDEPIRSKPQAPAKKEKFLKRLFGGSKNR